ncbi:SGNH/GDSL hydrolase family protein [Pseudomonas lactis]|uniref:SGNH/GDSL hydrolase family protein n=1 Tax=Pseudomonas lactis TaxID=1615674 RepID=UPI003F80A603
MAFNTGNPVEPNGSTDPRDLKDNATILDKLVNGSDLSWLGRLGKVLKTWAGMEKDFSDLLLRSGFESVFIPYAAGAIIDRATQLVQRNGELYRVINQADLPLTLTGNWAADELKLFAVGDAGLRANLNSPTGTSYITRGTQTLEQSLLNIDSTVTQVSDRTESGVFGDSNMRTRIRSSISANPSIYILGDSISHGAFAGDSYRNSWPNILKRCLNLDFGSISYGFTPLMTMGAGPTLTQDIHEILLSPPGAWQAREASTGSYIPQGLSWVSTASGNILSSTIPTFQNRVFVWYIGNPGGGTFDIKINGVVAASVNTSAASVTPINVQVVALTADKAGFSKIECVTTSAAKVELCGFSYVGPENTLTVNNFSNSGRRLRWVDESVINSMMNGTALFIMALGYNDSGDNQTNPAYFSEFKQRIDWLISYANLYEVPVVVPDFVWIGDPTDVTRLELKRLAKETKGVYIPFPDMFKKAYGAASDLYRRDTLKLFTDGAHPNIAGHKYIAETVAKRLGLSCTSKKQALDFYDWWYPLNIADTGITALGQTSDTVSAVKNNGSQYLLRLNLTGLGIGVANAKKIQFAWPARAGINQAFSTVHSLAPKTDGTPQGTVVITAGGDITANPNTNNGSTSNFVFVSAPTSDKGAR